MRKTGIDLMLKNIVKELKSVYAVGIDVSKGRSTVTIRKTGDKVVMSPRNFKHTQSEVNALIAYIRNLDGETKVCMECTGRYYEPMASWLHNAGIFVSAVNPLLIKNFKENSIRNTKTDKKDAIKIARYTLKEWDDLKEYTNTDEIRSQLKTMNRQFDFYMEQRTAMKNNLIAILDQTYSGVNDFFDSPVRKDGSQKWIDFAYTFWHVDIVRSMSLEEFSSSYKGWCKANGYNFSQTKAKEVYDASLDLIAVLPMDGITQILVQQAIDTLKATSQTVESFRLKMDEIASRLPEYPVVIDMYGVGHTLGPQLIAEIGDVTRFEKRTSLTAFAGVDPQTDESGDKISKSVPTSKKGSPYLRKTLFQIMDGLLKTKNENDPVYAFIDRKRDAGKPYHVYMTAGANKFLRIYFGRVREFLGVSGKNKNIKKEADEA